MVNVRLFGKIEADGKRRGSGAIDQISDIETYARTPASTHQFFSDQGRNKDQRCHIGFTLFQLKVLEDKAGRLFIHRSSP